MSKNEIQGNWRTQKRWYCVALSQRGIAGQGQLPNRGDKRTRRSSPPPRSGMDGCSATQQELLAQPLRAVKVGVSTQWEPLTPCE